MSSKSGKYDKFVLISLFLWYEIYSEKCYGVNYNPNSTSSQLLSP